MAARNEPLLNQPDREDDIQNANSKKRPSRGRETTVLDALAAHFSGASTVSDARRIELEERMAKLRPLISQARGVPFDPQTQATW